PVVSQRIVGGLLRHWAVDTQCAVTLLEQIKHHHTAKQISASLLTEAAEITDMNAAYFDAAHDFRGCIPGIHAVLQRQRLMEGIWCLEPREKLSPRQMEEIIRVRHDYPHLTDDAFIQQHRDACLK